MRSIEGLRPFRSPLVKDLHVGRVISILNLHKLTGSLSDVKLIFSR